MKSLPAVSLCLAAILSAHAADVVLMNNGDSRTGNVLGIEGRTIRLQVPLPPPPGTPADASPVYATTTVNLVGIAQIIFNEDPALKKLIASSSCADIPAVGAAWEKALPFLSVPRSPAGQAGLAFANLLLKSGDAANAQKALDTYSQVEAGSWSDQDKVSAREGRLRAMVATGRAGEAIHEAEQLAASAENPEVLIEAKFIMAESDATALRALIKENPRWEQDVRLVPEHARLLNSSLDLYLYPALFMASEREAAARGLWKASQLHDLVGNRAAALECARDIIAMYDGTTSLPLAKSYIDSLPEDIRATDPEADAKKDAVGQTPEPTPTPRKTNEKKNKKST